MAISIEDIEKTALLARLNLGEKEKHLYTAQINTILDYVGNLQELDTESIPPTINILPLYNVMREDITLPSLDRSEVFQNTSYEEDGMFRVPKIV